jgi:hypothetical protein
MKSFGDVVNMSKIDKVLKVEKFGVQALVVNLIQICTALALASDHLAPTEMANPSLESHIDALNDHLQIF